MLLSGLRESPGHQFWIDDLSLTDAVLFPTLPASPALTDLYLLGLAVGNHGMFATFDAGVDASMFQGGTAAYHVVAAV